MSGPSGGGGSIRKLLRGRRTLSHSNVVNTIDDSAEFFVRRGTNSGHHSHRRQSQSCGRGLVVGSGLTMMHLLLLLVVIVAAAADTYSGASSSSSSNSIISNTVSIDNDEPSSLLPPPSSGLVIEMARLSDAVYHLRNRVESCDDPRARDPTVVRAARKALRKIDAAVAAVAMEDGRRGDSAEYFEGGDNDSNNGDDGDDLFRLLLPPGCTCISYTHDRSRGTQTLVVRNDGHDASSGVSRYVAAAYAGTDDFATALSDGDVLTTDFGPEDEGEEETEDGSDAGNVTEIFREVPKDVRVHRGFNGAVFNNGGFDAVFRSLAEAKKSVGDGEYYRMYTTGHSLGAADSVLLGAALHLAFPSEVVSSINFGCPKIGNAAWRRWAASLAPGGSDDEGDGDDGRDFGHDGGGRLAERDNDGNSNGGLEIYRFVKGLDIVPRLPELFSHVGHTVQMGYDGKVRAYYEHLGDEALGYVGVPFGWGAAPYALAPVALYDHASRRYVKYLEEYRPHHQHHQQSQSQQTRGGKRAAVTAVENMKGEDDGNDDGDLPYFYDFERTTVDTDDYYDDPEREDGGGGYDPPIVSRVSVKTS